MTHYHVVRHSEDADPYVTGTVYSALDYAAQELRDLADFETSYVSGVAERVSNGDYVVESEMEDALKSYSKAETYNNLAINAQIRADNHEQLRNERPPLFQDDTTDDNDPRSLLFQSAVRVMDKINTESPLSIWDCEKDLSTDDNTGEMLHTEDMA